MALGVGFEEEFAHERSCSFKPYHVFFFCFAQLILPVPKLQRRFDHLQSKTTFRKQDHKAAVLL